MTTLIIAGHRFPAIEIHRSPVETCLPLGGVCLQPSKLPNGASMEVDLGCIPQLCLTDVTVQIERAASSESMRVVHQRGTVLFLGPVR